MKVSKAARPQTVSNGRDGRGPKSITWQPSFIRICEARSPSSRGRPEREHSRIAKATFREDRRLNIRLSSKDPEAIQKRALAEGLPYQTLIASLLHKSATGRLKEI
jgi:hypothetical protein